MIDICRMSILNLIHSMDTPSPLIVVGIKPVSFSHITKVSITLKNLILNLENLDLIWIFVNYSVVVLFSICKLIQSYSTLATPLHSLRITTFETIFILTFLFKTCFLKGSIELECFVVFMSY